MEKSISLMLLELKNDFVYLRKRIDACDLNVNKLMELVIRLEQEQNDNERND